MDDNTFSIVAPTCEYANSFNITGFLFLRFDPSAKCLRNLRCCSLVTKGQLLILPLQLVVEEHPASLRQVLRLVRHGRPGRFLRMHTSASTTAQEPSFDNGIALNTWGSAHGSSCPSPFSHIF